MCLCMSIYDLEDVHGVLGMPQRATYVYTYIYISTYVYTYIYTWKMCMASLTCRNARAYLPRRCRQMPMARSVLPSSAYVYVSMYRYCSICMHMPMARTNSMCKRTLFPWYIAKRCAFSYICCATSAEQPSSSKVYLYVCMYAYIIYIYV